MSVEERIERIQRLSRIQSLLMGSSDGYTSRGLSEEFGVTQRAIQRDLAELKSSPLNIPLKRQGLKWKIIGGYLPSLPPIQLSVHEATAMFLCALVACRFSADVNPYMVPLLVKLSKTLPGPIRLQYEGLLAYMSKKKSRNISRSVFDVLLIGWASQRKVRIWRCSNGDASAHDCLLSPFSIQPSLPGSSIHVIGSASDVEGIQALSIDHIVAAELTQEPYEVPSSFDTAMWLGFGRGELGKLSDGSDEASHNPEQVFPVFEHIAEARRDFTS